MKSFLGHCALVLASLALTWAAPRRTSRSSAPVWHLPCGEERDADALFVENIEDEIRSSLESLRVQHQLTMNDYLNRDYDFLYERMRTNVHDHQYIPNWVPGKRDVNIVKRLINARPETIVNHFPKLHMDLQKFAVAFEELIEDEPDRKIQEALRATQTYLTMMLCEVESDIGALPFLRKPSRVERSIMSSIERNPEDDTRRYVRDWGVVLRYKDYLHAWRHVLDY